MKNKLMSAEAAPAKVGHTPGPWILSEDGCSITSADGETLICETSKAAWENLAAAAAQGNTLADDHLPEVGANSRLLAAAPSLLAERDGLRDLLTHNGRKLRECAERRDALLKACKLLSSRLSCDDAAQDQARAAIAANEEDGTSGQDRKHYTDTQDRKHYT